MEQETKLPWYAVDNINSFETTKLGAMKYIPLSEHIKKSEDIKLFENFCQMLLETIYLNRNTPFEKEAKVSILVDQNNHKIQIVSQTRNTVRISDMLPFLWYLPTRSLSVRKNLTESFEIKDVFGLIFMNWEGIIKRLNERESVRKTVEEKNYHDFKYNFRNLIELVEKAAVH